MMKEKGPVESSHMRMDWTMLSAVKSDCSNVPKMPVMTSSGLAKAG